MPIPFGLTGSQFANRFRGMLEKHSSALIAELRELLDKPISGEVPSASIWITLDEYGESGPTIVLYFDGTINKRVADSDPLIFPGRSIAIANSVRRIEQFDDEYFTDKDFSALQIQADVITTWFAEWWWKAGGWNYPVSVDVVVEDDYWHDTIQLAPGR